MVVLSRKGYLSFYDASGRPAGPGVALDKGASALGCFDSGEAKKCTEMHQLHDAALLSVKSCQDTST